MVTVIYTEPHQKTVSGKKVWLIGWSKTQFEKCKCNIYHAGTKEDAQAKIDSYNCKKYKKQ